ncbi:hypothetical protein PCE1_001764 [Barthelona sp. PCE]
MTELCPESESELEEEKKLASVNILLFVISAAAFLVTASQIFTNDLLYYKSDVGKYAIIASITWLYISVLYTTVRCILYDDNACFYTFRTVFLDIPIAVLLTIFCFLTGYDFSLLIIAGILAILCIKLISPTGKLTFNQILYSKLDIWVDEWKKEKIFIEFGYNSNQYGKFNVCETIVPEELECSNNRLYLPTTHQICIIYPSVTCTADDDYTVEYEENIKNYAEDRMQRSLFKRVKRSNVKSIAVVMVDKAPLWFNPIFFVLISLFSPYHSWYSLMLYSSSYDGIYVDLRKKYKFVPKSFESRQLDNAVELETEAGKQEVNIDISDDEVSTLKKNMIAMKTQITELQAQLIQQTAVVKVNLEPSAPNACDEPTLATHDKGGIIYIPTAL